jgi:hypothetical protein
MFFFSLLVNQYNIDEYHDKLVQLLHKNLVHQIHKVGRSISQSKDITVYLYGPFLKMKEIFRRLHSCIFN